MLDVFHELVRRHRHSGLIVDTNLLVLFLVGLADAARIPQFKRTAEYTADDHVLLALMIKEFDRIIVTPNILTETSNLCAELAEPLKSTVFIGLQALLPSKAILESYQPSGNVSAAVSFLKFGLTDSGVEAAASKGHPVLTDDFPLYLHLCDRGLEAFNFAHVRFWLS